MKAVLIALCLSLLTAEAQAISRHNPTRMSCDQVQATIAQEGAVILRYTSPRSGLPRYDRYVASRDFCDLGEVRNRTYVPSADYRSCPVYNCKRFDFEDRRRFIFPGD